MTSPPTLDPLPVLARYAAGYFPMMDLPDAAGRSEFFWDRWPIRAILPVNEQTLARARRMARRAQAVAAGGGGPFEIRHTTAVEEVIAQLQTAKENSWVQQEVVALYRALHAANLLRTIEAWLPAAESIRNQKSKTENSPARLVGALLGIVLPGTFIAETMYGIVPEASKICLCQLVEDCAAAGFEMIDVQTPHDTDEFGAPLPRPRNATAHPCIRLGEIRLPLKDFLHQLTAAWSRAFPGDISAWLTLAAAARSVANPIGPVAPTDPRRFLLRPWTSQVTD